MYISLPLFFLAIMGFFLISGSSSQKQGDFGIFTACLKNGSLRLDCYYPSCAGSPPFHCEFRSWNDVWIANRSNEMCKYTMPNQGPLSTNQTLRYKCILRRKLREEKKALTVDFSIRKGKDAIKPCPDTTGLPLHQAPPMLWLAVPLWRLLVPDAFTT